MSSGRNHWIIGCLGILGLIAALTACGSDAFEDSNSVNNKNNSNKNNTTNNANNNTPKPDGDVEPKNDGGVVLDDTAVTPNDCGNKQIDAGEECDGDNLNDMTCQALGFTGGSLTCGADCKLDNSGCSGTPPTGQQFGQLCGGTVGDCDQAKGLTCALMEQGSDVGFCTAKCSETVPCPSLPKNAECMFQLGNDTVCGFVCSAANPVCPPGLNCGPDDYCTTASSAPTGAKFGDRCGGSYGQCVAGLDCISFTELGNDQWGFCTAGCSDTNPCPSSPPNAECFLKDQNTGLLSCGFVCDASAPCPGQMACSSDGYCTSDEPATCNNNVLEFGEECDGTALNNLSCAAFGFSSGTLKCNTSCKYDTSGCSGSTCNLPPLKCTAGTAACSKLELFEPVQGDGYLRAYPEYYGYLRHDAIMHVKHAAAAVACLMPGSLPVHTLDMSMSDGSVPKYNTSTYQPCYQESSTCQKRHWAGHEGGYDIDISYYQTQDMADPGPVCPHTLNGKEQYHCVSAPTILHADRTALFLGKLFESGRIRVIGVDAKIAPLVQAAAQKLVQSGLITTTAYNLMEHSSPSRRLGYDTDPSGSWYQFHHHHFHVSHVGSSYASPMMPEETDDWATAAAELDDKPYALSIIHPDFVDSSNVPTIRFEINDRKPRLPLETFEIRKLPTK